MADPNDGSRATSPSSPGDVVKISCSCGAKLSIKAEHAGKKARCGKCQAVLVVPSAITASAHVNPLETHAFEGSLPGTNGTAAAATWSFLAPAQAADEIGRLGPYRVLQVLGAGGMGVVFKAEDPALKRVVALKAMLPEANHSPEAKERFLREARTAAALKHDHIVCIHQVGEDRDVPFLAMEFLKGESLDDRLKREGHLSISEAVRIGSEVADGLAAAHEEGLIHRDIKPANIWMEARAVRRDDGSSAADTAPARAKILDFGLARGTGDAHLTQTGVIIGTPAYMPPEQARGEPVDARCDLYSLGVLLYKMLTGVVPFKGGNTLAILSALALETPKEPVLLNPTIPAPLNDLIMRLLAKEAADRPGSAQEVYSALRNIKTAPATARSRVAPKRRRSALWAAILLLALAGLTVLLALVVVRIQTPKGTLIIESDDPDTEIVVKHNGAVIRDKTKEREMRLAVGDYEIELVDPKSGLKLSAKSFTLTRNGQPVRVRLEKEAVAQPVVPREATPTVVRCAADALRREDIPEAVLANIGQGDPKAAPRGLVAVLGEGRFRLNGISSFLTYSPNGKYLAVPSGNDVKVFDAGSGRCLKTLRGHENRVFVVTFAPDNETLASGSNDKTVRLWQISTGREILKLPGYPDTTMALSFSPNQAWLAYAWDDNKVRVWDLAAKKIRFVLAGHKDKVFGLSFSPDGRTLASASDDATVKLWDLSTGEDQCTLPHGEVKNWPVVKFSPDGRILATGDDSKLRLWNVATRKQIWEQSTPAVFIAFEPDEQSILSGACPQRGVQTVKRWDKTTGEERPPLALPSRNEEVVFSLSPDGHTLAALGIDDRVVQLYDAATGQPRSAETGHTRQVYSVAFSPDGRWLASGCEDQTVRVWDLATGKQRHLLKAHDDKVWSVAFSPDSRWLASGSHDGTIVLWNPVTGKKVRTLRDHSRDMSLITFSPDSSQVAAGTADGGVRFWDAGNGEELRTLPGLHKGLVRCVGFSADGRRLISGGADGKVVITDVASGKALQSFQRKSPVTTVEFSKDEKTLAAGYDQPDGVACLWNVQNQDCVTLSGHTSHVGSLAIGMDGALLLTTGFDDHSARLWEITSPRPAKLILGMDCFGGPVWHSAFGPDGRHLATANNDGTIFVFRLPPLSEKVSDWMQAWGSPPLPGLTHEVWLQRVKGLSAGNLVLAVSERLCEVNPGFDGKINPTLQDGVVIGLVLNTDEVADLLPLQALVNLQRLSCGGSTHGFYESNSKLRDLTPLKSLRLRTLYCGATQVSDLSALRGMPLVELSVPHLKQLTNLEPLRDMRLRILNISDSRVKDLSPLRDMPLEILDCALNGNLADVTPLAGTALTRLEVYNTSVENLSPLEGLPLQFLDINATRVSNLQPLSKSSLVELHCRDTGVTDFSSLKNVPLRFLRCSLPPERNTDALRAMSSLERINDVPVAEFWKSREPKKP